MNAPYFHIALPSLPFFPVSLSLLLLLSAPLCAQDTIRVVTYNLLEYSASTVTAERDSALRMVIRTIHPHIIVAQEVVDADGLERFRIDVAREATGLPFVAAPFVDGPGSDNVMLYDSARVRLDKVDVIPTASRNIIRYRITTRRSLQLIDIYAVHLTEGNTAADIDARYRESVALRRFLDTADGGSTPIYFMLAGTVNNYSGSEPSVRLILDSTALRFNDPINRRGEWHESSTYAFYHTQSSRVRAFGGGADGGLDDRFDVIYFSSLLGYPFVPGTYTTLGNDGEHLDDSVNRKPNSVVDDAVADALHEASDHLPVYADLQFPLMQVEASEGDAAGMTIAAAPNPASETVHFSIDLAGRSEIDLRLYDARGDEVALIAHGRFEAGAHIVHGDVRRLPSGSYRYLLRSGTGTRRGTIVVVR